MFTGDKYGAGTDSKVYLTLYGKNGDSGKYFANDVQLQSSTNRVKIFWGHENVFKVIWVKQGVLLLQPSYVLAT